MTLEPERARRRLREARLYLLLTRRLCRLDPLTVLEAALDGGVDLVQVRETEFRDRELLEWVHDVKERCAPFRVPVIVNDRADIAILAGAEGVHVGQEDLPPRAVRELVGSGMLVGQSTHDFVQLTEAAAGPVDYVGVGPVFTSNTKAVEGHGSGWLRDILPHAMETTFAIGGIGPDNLEEVLAAGFKRIALCAAICGAEDPGAVARQMRSALAQVD
jgi:thiamine-phosphate pyrophosphorylase